MRHSHSHLIAAASGSRTGDAARSALTTSGGSGRGGSATLERTLAHTFTSPVVREMLPTRARAVATW